MLLGHSMCLLKPASVWPPLRPFDIHVQLDDVMGQAQSVAGSLTGQRRLFSNIGSKLADVTARFPVVNNLLTSIRRRKNRVSTQINCCFPWQLDKAPQEGAAAGVARCREHHPPYSSMLDQDRKLPCLAVQAIFLPIPFGIQHLLIPECIARPSPQLLYTTRDLMMQGHLLQ